MRQTGFILFLLPVFFPFILSGQVVYEELRDSLSTINSTDTLLVDSIQDKRFDHIQAPVLEIDTTKSIYFWNITERTGEIIPVRPDTFLTDYFNRTNVEGMGISVAYLGNLGLPTESRIFFERDDRSQFMFSDPYRAYAKTPGNFDFLNTKIPYSNISYQRAGDRAVREERLQALLAFNVGKKINIGFDVDYLYARGFYTSQAAKHMEWVCFGNYISDRHQLHLFFNPSDYTNAENGGIEDDRWISHPDYMDRRVSNTLEIPVRFSNVWNHIKGKQIYLNYHYNLGFEREIQYKTDSGNVIKQFIPVSSIIYTFDYKERKKKFYSTGTLIDDYYNKTNWFEDDRLANDSTSYRLLSNTLALSLREGFSDWAKFDLTAFLTYEIHNFTTMDSLNHEEKQSTVYVGGELFKRKGKILRYKAQGKYGILGNNFGDFDISGNIETRIPVGRDTASINANAFIKNLSPTYYENRYRSKYFQWDNKFEKVTKVFIGGNIDIPHTKTNFGLGVENLTNYIYFDKTGYPKQFGKNIQILGVFLNQNFQLKALHWDNQFVYQKSGRADIVPLPDFTAYSSLYVHFKIAKVLTIQMGVNAHYWTKYYAPAYEPATQQFKLQDEVKVGNYPLLGGFLNCHLKQTRFFIEYYNASALFITPTEYFSLPHYPVNPTVLKLGLSVNFIN
ncbi:MAG: putative porin [Dysgonamonadaceae bacterium]|nr:putative porin [Dysgonamonadaceae bacterium]